MKYCISSIISFIDPVVGTTETGYLAMGDDKIIKFVTMAEHSLALRNVTKQKTKTFNDVRTETPGKESIPDFLEDDK